MTGRTHDLAAFTALSIVAFTLPLQGLTLSTLLLALLANQLGGIAPDIDQPTAPFWRNLPIGKYFGKIFGAASGGYRFITHSLLGVALFGVGILALLELLHPIMPTVNSGYVWWAFMIGMVSHLILDSFTKEGVPWLLPIPVKFGIPPIKRFRMVSGKKAEVLIVFPLLVVICIVFYTHHAQEVTVFLRHYIT